MSPAEAAIRQALAAGPTDGPWAAKEWSYSDQDGALESCGVQVVAVHGTTEVGIFSSSVEGDDAMEIDVRYIAACNPAAIRSLLSELDALRARCEAADKLLLESRRRLVGVTAVASKGDRDTHIGHLDAIDAHLKGAGRE